VFGRVGGGGCADLMTGAAGGSFTIGAPKATDRAHEAVMVRRIERSGD
jgi:hypothetical protein